MTTLEQLRVLDERLIDEALREVRWRAMTEEVRQRLPQLCRDTSEAYLWSRVRLALRSRA